MADDLPASLKPIKPYLEAAKRFKAADPVVAYHCRLFAMQEAMNMRAKIPKPDMGFVITLMDQLESEKAALGDLSNAAITVENFALTLFERADDADRSGKSTLPVAKDFLVSSQILETCRQFGELSEDLLEKIKYAKWRFVEICKATKEKRPPAPPRGDPPMSDTLPPTEAGGDGVGAPSTSGAPPQPPPPDADYLGLPPVDPQPSVPPVVPPSIPGGYPQEPPPPYAAVPPAVPPTVPPAVPQVPGVAAQLSAGSTAALSTQAAPNLGRAQIMEAMKLCQSAVSALQFQDAETAVHTLHKALSMLTTPPTPQAP